MAQEKIQRKVCWTIRKFANESDFEKGILIDPPIKIDGNLLLNEGITALQNLLTGGAETPFDNANAFIGVGDSSAAAVATQTGLQAATNKLYKALDASYPTITGQVTRWRATFGSAEANFAWNELTVANGNSDAAVNLNRKVSAQGTKVSGQTWQLDLDITWS